jgi:purine-binding chemotaxis protein CheW
MSKKDRLGADPLSWIQDSRLMDSHEADQGQRAQTAEPAKKSRQKERAAGVNHEENKLESVVAETAPAKSLKSTNSKKLVETQIARANAPIPEMQKGDIDSLVENFQKYLTFCLADEEYGIEILKVVEIIGVLPITRVPRTPAYLKGVINLRGRIIPVIDLRLKFGLCAAEQTEETCIIVVHANNKIMGVMVDRVSEVVDLAKNAIEEAPSFGSNLNTDYILGVGKVQDKIKLLLDIDKVIAQRNVIGSFAQSLAFLKNEATNNLN